MNVFGNAAAALAVVGTVGGGFFAIDETYVRRTDFDSFQWGVLKEQIRELRKEIEARGDIDDVLDLEELLDRFCRAFPDDRECRDDG